MLTFNVKGVIVMNPQTIISSLCSYLQLYVALYQLLTL